MAGFGGSSGFTLLVWCDRDSWRFEGMDSQQRHDTEKELLADVITLLCGRWGMEGSIVEDSGDTFAFFVCPRFVISTATLTRALGTLAGTMKFHRGSATDNWKLLVEYRKCLLKYDVPDKVSEGSFGEGFEGSQSGHAWSQPAKRARK
ncbi:nonstructural protein 3 [Duck-associated chapparvovirus 1]|uniref:Nonstructural protein 3 n=1 Tax=Duck-associated chapparvovirus 1 TaxID=2810802 RepID=A0A891EZ25_9VIRU|nr:nonstructural protein 3 [Duck-associated chapparvovirus 1]QRK03680.1 nonstructural protein 3 [Duck-associated chapparvovirus 1]QRK03684.1 nonstructural protein 3 [Duck-associated chapparvovirus 1]